MPEYKLFYFDGRGLAEVTRQLFHIADIPFEDVRITVAEWPEQQPQMPLGKVPVLEVDGQMIPQSLAVARYVARQTGHAGKTPVEEAIVDALADQYKDFYEEMKPYYYSATGYVPKTKEELEEIKKTVLIPARDKYLGYLTVYLKKNPSGFLIGDGLTFADLILAEHVSTLKEFVPDYTEGFPEIEAHLQKVHNIPELKKWLSARPKTIF